MEERTGMPTWLRVLLILFGIGAICALTGGIFAYIKCRQWIAEGGFPDVDAIAAEHPNVTTKILDRNGKEIGDIAVERRTILPYDEIPKVMKDAVVAAEDDTFWQHHGLNYFAILVATVENLTVRRHARGGSTLTQQIAKRYVGNERTIKRKVREAYLTVQIEEHWKDKKKILEFYLNNTYFGHQRIGVEEAAKYLFGKTIREVTLHEAALIASLPKAPEVYYRPSHHASWKRREGYVLRKMVENGWATQEAANAAFSEKIKLADHSEVNPASEFLDVAEKQLHVEHGKDLGKLGLTIKTTCDLDLQKSTRVALEKGLDDINKNNGLRSRPQAAAILMDVHTREVLAMVGGYGHKRSQLNRALEAKRQPGSTFKSVIYAAALSRPWTNGNMEIAPSSTFVDEEKTYEIPGSLPWTPRNHGPASGERVSLRTALARSLNTVSAQVTNEIGPDTAIEMAKLLGIKSELRRPLGHDKELIAPLSIALGTSEVTPMEVMNAYATFAAQGKYLDPQFVLHEKSEKAPEEKQVISPALAYVMTSLLTSVVQEGTGVRARSLNLPIAGKTGTTQSSTDAWFVGYTADYIAIVWVGYDDSRHKLGSNWEGSRAALPIWMEIMKAATQGKPRKTFVRPSGVVEQDGEVFLAGKIPTTTPEPEGEKPETQPTDVAQKTEGQPATDQPVSAPKAEAPTEPAPKVAAKSEDSNSDPWK